MRPQVGPRKRTATQPSTPIYNPQLPVVTTPQPTRSLAVSNPGVMTPKRRNLFRVVFDTGDTTGDAFMSLQVLKVSKIVQPAPSKLGMIDINTVTIKFEEDNSGQLQLQLQRTLNLTSSFTIHIEHLDDQTHSPVTTITLHNVELAEVLHGTLDASNSAKVTVSAFFTYDSVTVS